MRVLWVGLVACAAVSVCSAASGGYDGGFLKLNSRKRFTDSYGRERVFHGVNVVYKSAPWLPILDHFDPQLSFSTQDMQYLQDWGINVIRLGLMWPGVEPARGVYNDTYLQQLRGLVARAATYDIAVVLDVHQDSLARLLCGEGMPDWAVMDAVTPTGLKNFPLPVAKPFPRDPTTHYPSIPTCHSVGWATYEFTAATATGYQAWYDSNATSPTGLRESFAAFWRKSASVFADMPSVVGYELINEPFVGDLYRDPELLVPWVADRKNLQPFYDAVVTAIRTVDQRVVMFEPVTFSGQPVVHSDTIGFTGPPAGDAQTALAYHYYDPPNFGNTTEYFARRQAAAAELGVGSFVTEFDLSSSGAGMLAAMDVMDSHPGLSWILWEYKSFAGALPNGTCTGCGRGPILANGTLDEAMLSRMIRGSAQATAGELLSQRFNVTTQQLVVSFTPDASITAPTVLSAPAAADTCTTSSPSFKCTVQSAPRPSSRVRQWFVQPVSPAAAAQWPQDAALTVTVSVGSM